MLKKMTFHVMIILMNPWRVLNLQPPVVHLDQFVYAIPFYISVVDNEDWTLPFDVPAVPEIPDLDIL